MVKQIEAKTKYLAACNVYALDKEQYEKNEDIRISFT